MPVPHVFTRVLPLTALLCCAVQAVNLTPTQRLNLPGPATVTALASLPDGSRLLCLGNRWVKLNNQGQVTVSVPLAQPCHALNVNRDGTQVLTSPDGKVWSARDGQQIRSFTDVQPAGFLNNQDLLVSSSTGLERLNISSGQRTPLHPTGFKTLSVSPDGRRAIASDGQRVQFLTLPDLTSLSAYRCDTDCTVKNATFSADGRTAITQVGRNLIGLWDGHPATTIQRNVENATGFIQLDNTAVTISEAGVEVHDFQTGRREKQVTTGVTTPAAQLPDGRILALSDKGELLDADITFKDVKRFPLPATAQAGGLDTSGNVYALNKGSLTLGQKKVNGTYWAVETMNKTTWALRSDSDGGIQIGTLSGEKFTPIPGSPRTATHLSVNHWGNHAAVWDDETLWVVSQAQNKVITTLKLPLKGASVTLSPDATRAYVVSSDPKTDAFVITLANGKRFPLPYALAGGRPTGVQLSGKGVLALAATRDNVTLYRSNEKQNFASLEGRGEIARFSPDGQWLALPFYNRVDIVNTETGKVETSSPALASLPTFLTWSADSKKLAVGASLLTELSSVTVFDVR